MSNLLVLAKVSCLPSHLLFCQLGNRTHPASFGISVSLTFVQGCTYDLGHIFSAFLKVHAASQDSKAQKNWSRIYGQPCN